MRNQSLKLLAQAFRLEPNRWDAYELQGVLAAEDGHLDQAVASFQKSLALNPNGSKAHLNLAHLFLKQGRSTDARQEFQSALENGLEPGDERDARRHLGELSEGLANDTVHAGARTNAPLAPSPKHDKALHEQ